MSALDSLDEVERMSEQNNRYYFAYGSNMDQAQMGQRCPGAIVVGIARLAGYQFVINDRGVATVVPDPSSEVYGVLWNLTAAYEKTLDTYEGVEWGTYEKMEMDVEMGSEKPQSALVYVAVNTAVGSPRPGYMERIVAAAELYRLPDRYVEELKSWLTTPG